MNLLWPGFLALLLLVPLLLAAYLWVLRRRRRFAVRYSSLSLVRAAMPRYSRLRRHLPFALFLVALTSLVITLSRPQAVIQVPTGRTTIMLTMDVSGSMRATDIRPSRLQAAQDAALSFIRSQGPGTQIGIVGFAGFAQLIQPSTTDQRALETAINSLSTARGTAMGSGILESLDALADINSDVAPTTRGRNANSTVTPVPQGSYVPDIIVVLTDGVTTTGPLPLEAAQQAVDRGVRVYTIGFGTENGGLSYGNGFGGGGGNRGLDEDTLRGIATMTGGEYYQAESAGELEQVFRDLPNYTTTREETTEISFLFAAIGGLFALAAIVLSMLWNPMM